MASFLSLPDEILRLILRGCDTLSQLSALTLTCKQLHSVYSNNIHSIWCQVGRRNIPSFENAVITSRATRIVLEHFAKGQFPPAPFPLDRLPTSAQNICLEDIQSLIDWRHFVICMETVCLHQTGWGRQCASIKPADEFAEPSTEWITWRESFHRSMYRSFLMGAVLCRTYQEPLVQGANQPKNFLEKFAKRPKERHLRLRQAEIDYLLTFPVFNLEAYETHEPIYGPLADFFVRHTQPDANNELSATTMYPTNATPDEGLDRAHASAVYAAMVQCLLSSMIMWHDGLFFTDETKKSSPERTLRLVRAGPFYPEEISMPVHAHDAKHTRLHRRPLLTGDNEDMSAWTENARQLDEVLNLMHESSGQPNVYAEDQCAPYPPLQIFQFIARRYLGLRFMKNAFALEVGATEDWFVSHLNTGNIYLGIWPERVPSGWPRELPPMFDIVDGEREYVAYYEPL